MDELRPDEIAARVLAWQHRDPLARRIRASQVQSVGVVALPFAVVEGADEDAAAPAFSEDFIAPLAPARVARFAAAHAVAALPLAAGTPLREVAGDPLPAGQVVRHRFLLTAAIEAEGQRTRVLLGPAPGAPVLGRRLPDRRRQGLAASALAGLALAVFDWTALPGEAPPSRPAPGIAAMPPPAAPAMPEAIAASAAAAPVAAVASAAPAASAAVALAPAPGPEAPAYERPADVEPRWGTVSLPPRPQVVKPLPRRRTAAAPPAAAAAGAVAAAVPATAKASTAGAAASPPAIVLPPRGEVWAVSTRLVRTRAESEQLAHAMRALVGTDGDVQVEAVAVGADWRVAAWPFLRRRDAERTQAMLAARGMRAEVVAF
ncbi:MAG: hypothetical protein KF863_04950 [Rubrivivax sp.]|nr:hypothetical protein [Rubrivivax sp.]